MICDLIEEIETGTYLVSENRSGHLVLKLILGRKHVSQFDFDETGTVQTVETMTAPLSEHGPTCLLSPFLQLNFPFFKSKPCMHSLKLLNSPDVQGPKRLNKLKLLGLPSFFQLLLLFLSQHVPLNH